MKTFLIGGTGPMPIPIVSIPPQRYYRVVKEVDPSIIVLLLPAGGLLDMNWTMRRLEKKIRRMTKPGELIYLIGHSQGAIMAGWIAARNPDLVIRVVGVFPPWFGSRVTPLEGPLSWAPICDWLSPGSTLLEPVRQEVAGVLGDRMINIVSPEDGIVVPFHSGILPGVQNLLIGSSEDFEKHSTRFPDLVHLFSESAPKHLHIGNPHLIQGICTALGRNAEIPTQRAPLEAAPISASP